MSIIKQAEQNKDTPGTKNQRKQEENKVGVKSNPALREIKRQLFRYKTGSITIINISFLYFILVSFSLCSAYDIIPISDFQNLTLKFNSKYSNYILKYSPNTSKTFKNLSIIINWKVISGNDNYIQKLYLYDNIDIFIKDLDNKNFLNYQDYIEFSNDSNINTFDITNSENKIYYISFENNNNIYSTEISLKIFSAFPFVEDEYNI